jgi:3',5'-cyclic AMP phosphodiesterase CpdA
LGVPVTVEVGNHDLPYFDLIARFFRPYRRIREVEQLIEKPLDLPDVAIVPLVTTARFQWRLNWAKGRVGRRSLKEALSGIESVSGASRDKLVFVACHHPLIEAETSATGRTRGGAAAIEALARSGVDAVLTGHVHDPFDIVHDVAGRQVRMIGAGTLSRRTRDTPPSFNEIVIDGAGFSVIVRTLSADPNRILPVGRAP